MTSLEGEASGTGGQVSLLAAPERVVEDPQAHLLKQTRASTELLFQLDDSPPLIAAFFMSSFLTCSSQSLR